MSSDDHKGIANILNLPVRNPVRNPKVEPQEDPIISLSESLMRIKPLELPKNISKEDYKYNDKNPIHRSELNKYLTRNTSNSDGAWKAFVKANTDPNRPKHIEPVEYIEQMKSKHGSYNNYTRNLVKHEVENSQTKIGNAPPGSKQQKTDVLNYVNKMTEIYDGPRISDQPILKANINNRYVNKSLNNFENRTENKDVVTFDPTTQLFTDETRNIAFKDYKNAKAWNDKINGQPTATGQQVNDLKARLDNARDYSYEPKKKKISTPLEPVKLDLTPTYLPPAIEKDPQMEIAQRNFERLNNEIREEKFKNANSGLAALVGGDPEYGK